MAISENKKLRLYELVIRRYSSLISDKELVSITQIRHRTSPYSSFIKKIGSKLISSFVEFEYKKDLRTFLGKSLAYLNQWETAEFSFTFYLEFEEMEKLEIATELDKCILLCALIRFAGSDNVKVIMTKSGKSLVKMNLEGTDILIFMGNGDILSKDSVFEYFSKNPIEYSFNDLNFEEFD